MVRTTDGFTRPSEFVPTSCVDCRYYTSIIMRSLKGIGNLNGCRDIVFIIDEQER